MTAAYRREIGAEILSRLTCTLNTGYDTDKGVRLAGE